mmetsp:Transcript_30142/g.96976  ORF Transcript_30142/g.96976 Transcript_30142/m.96976 type:complete len:131 (+) Transcript_30142:70-462(+)
MLESFCSLFRAGLRGSADYIGSELIKTKCTRTGLKRLSKVVERSLSVDQFGLMLPPSIERILPKAGACLGSRYHNRPQSLIKVEDLEIPEEQLEEMKQEIRNGLQAKQPNKRKTKKEQAESSSLRDQIQP